MNVRIVFSTVYIFALLMVSACVPFWNGGTHEDLSGKTGEAGDSEGGTVGEGGSGSGGSASGGTTGPAAPIFAPRSKFGTGFSREGALASEVLIRAVEVSPDGLHFFVGGSFTHFNGRPVGKIVKFSRAGDLIPEFDTSAGTLGGFSHTPIQLAAEPVNDGLLVLLERTVENNVEENKLKYRGKDLDSVFVKLNKFGDLDQTPESTGFLPALNAELVNKEPSVGAQVRKLSTGHKIKYIKSKFSSDIYNWFLILFNDSQLLLFKTTGNAAIFNQGIVIGPGVNDIYSYEINNSYYVTYLAGKQDATDPTFDTNFYLQKIGNLGSGDAGALAGHLATSGLSVVDIGNSNLEDTVAYKIVANGDYVIASVSDYEKFSIDPATQNSVLLPIAGQLFEAPEYFENSPMYGPFGSFKISYPFGRGDKTSNQNAFLSKINTDGSPSADGSYAPNFVMKHLSKGLNGFGHEKPIPCGITSTGKLVLSGSILKIGTKLVGSYNELNSLYKISTVSGAYLSENNNDYEPLQSFWLKYDMEFLRGGVADGGCQVLNNGTMIVWGNFTHFGSQTTRESNRVGGIVLLDPNDSMITVPTQIN